MRFAPVTCAVVLYAYALATFPLARPADARASVVAMGSATASVCIDSSSPTAGLDRRVTRAAARVAGMTPTIYEYDGTYGVSEKLFRALVREHCSLLMGYPVDSVAPDPPRGLSLTKRYFTTGYVLATLGRPLTVKTLPRDSSVAVGLGTVPNFYLVGALGPAPPVRADAYQSQEEAIAALLRGTDRAAMLWEPSIRRYRALHGERRIVVSPLPIEHDRWQLAALYDPVRSAAAARRFEAAVARLDRSGELAHLTQSSESEFAQ